MKALTKSIEVPTSGKGSYEITRAVAGLVRDSGVQTGTATVFIRHTSASLIISENADPSVQTDMAGFFERIVPEDDDYYAHTLEGPDDMTSHIRSALTATSLVIPIAGGRLQLGTWQGIFVFEHRVAPHRRSVVVTAMGL